MTPDPTTDPEAFLPLPELSFQLLLALADGPGHGYGIGKALEERTEGRLKPTTGSLYQALRRLDEKGLIEEAQGPEGADGRRQYFRLTPLGRRAAAAEAARLHRLVLAARDRDLFPAS